MIEIIKSFLNKCDGNEELTKFAEGLFECIGKLKMIKIF